MKTYTIEVNGSELSLIIWGLQSLSQQNGGALLTMSALIDGFESADTDTLAAKLTAVRKQEDHAVLETRKLAQAGLAEVKR